MASAEAVPSTSAALSRRTRSSPEHFRCREGSPTPHIWLIPGDRCVRGLRHRTVCPAGVLGAVAIQAAITGRRGAAVRPHADRAGHRRGLGYRHRLHRRVGAKNRRGPTHGHT